VAFSKKQYYPVVMSKTPKHEFQGTAIYFHRLLLLSSTLNKKHFISYSSSEARHTYLSYLSEIEHFLEVPEVSSQNSTFIVKRATSLAEGLNQPLLTSNRLRAVGFCSRKSYERKEKLKTSKWGKERGENKASDALGFDCEQVSDKDKVKHIKSLITW